MSREPRNLPPSSYLIIISIVEHQKERNASRIFKLKPFNLGYIFNTKKRPILIRNLTLLNCPGPKCVFALIVVTLDFELLP